VVDVKRGPVPARDLLGVVAGEPETVIAHFEAIAGPPGIHPAKSIPAPAAQARGFRPPPTRPAGAKSGTYNQGRCAMQVAQTPCLDSCSEPLTVPNHCPF